MMDPYNRNGAPENITRVTRSGDFLAALSWWTSACLGAAVIALGWYASVRTWPVLSLLLVVGALLFSSLVSLVAVARSQR